MSAQAQMRALLDQLMGTARDGDETRQRVKFTDDRVCKSHLLDCCPHDILAGTRMDLGECTKIHDLALRADYEIASKERDLFFELDAMDHLESFIAECDRRTELAKKRLAETQEEISAEVSAKAEKVHELNEEIGKLLAKAEQLGAEGNVDESQKILMEVEKVRAKKKEAEEEYRNSMPASSFQQQKLRVCEVCSAYLGLHDNDRRLADHFGGKLHLGFIQIREKLDQLRVSSLYDLLRDGLFFPFSSFELCLSVNTGISWHLWLLPNSSSYFWFLRHRNRLFGQRMPVKRLFILPVVILIC
uniref:LUC7 like n=1 Tax=Vombatus ursinus TaxID=29139 RepID=A0A4X2LG95_VOMUR